MAGNRHPELRRNPVTGTVVVISVGREKKLEQLRRTAPRDWSKLKPEQVSGEQCPFCKGHEKDTPSEVLAYRERGSQVDGSGWWVRVVPNLYSAVDASVPGEELVEASVGPYLVTPGFGYHYVIIETPAHDCNMQTIVPRQCREVVSMWRDLTNKVGGDRNVRYVFVFQNYGQAAGMSIPHAHSQMIALPVIPTRVLNELRGSRDYYDTNRECPYCRELEWELRVGERVIAQSDHFVAWCPFTSKTPYQMVISPRAHESYFGNISTHGGDNSELAEFSGLLQNVLKRMGSTLNDPDWNLYFHTAPTNQPVLPFYHWHCQIEPVTAAIVAGFEKGSGVFINTRSPESAANDLRAAVIS